MLNNLAAFLLPEWSRHLMSMPSLAKFALGMAIIVGIPRLSRRVRLPAVVGFLLCGVVIGPHCLAVLGEHAPVADFFAEIGKLMLMFCAGLEINLALFRKAQGRSIMFGIITTMVPLLLGTAVGFWFGYKPVAAVVLGSLLASHTLLAAPIVVRLGATKLEPITVTFGATIVSDTLSLVVFAICVSTYQTGFSMSQLGLQLLEITIFILFILFGLSRIGAYLLKKVQDDEGTYFVLMLGIMAVAGVLADTINLPGIVGAFLAGLAVNGAVQDAPAKEKLEFFGNEFFVPIFFIVTGFLIDPVVFWHTIISSPALVVAVIGALLIGKMIAAEAAGRAFSYSPIARLTMWSLTLPQVAATLAATLVAFNTMDRAGQRLLDGRLLNVTLVLVLTTSILGPVLTERFAPLMMRSSRGEDVPLKRAA
jgi:Kef-type K+ transport system membrane component KefB